MLPPWLSVGHVDPDVEAPEPKPKDEASTIVSASSAPDTVDDAKFRCSFSSSSSFSFAFLPDHLTVVIYDASIKYLSSNLPNLELLSPSLL